MTCHAKPRRRSGICASSRLRAAMRAAAMRAAAMLTAAMFVATMLSAPLAAAQPTWQLGTRFTVLAADAPPANDMPGWSLVARRALGEGSRWRAGIALDRYEFDHEEPYKPLGIALPTELEAIDAVNESTVLSAFVERHCGSAAVRYEWF